jgi:hypothetical protein
LSLSALDPNQCIDLAGGKVDNGNLIDIYDCKSITNQKWQIGAQPSPPTPPPAPPTPAVPTPAPAPVTGSIQYMGDGGKANKCMDLSNGGDTKNGNKMDL